MLMNMKATRISWNYCLHRAHLFYGRKLPISKRAASSQTVLTYFFVGIGIFPLIFGDGYYVHF